MPEGAAAAEEGKPSDAVQKRFDTLTASLANRDQHIQVLTQRLDAMERQQAQPPARTQPATTVAEPAKFTFPSFEVYQETHTDATYEQYIDERTDAKFEHRQQVADEKWQSDNDQRREEDGRLDTRRRQTAVGQPRFVQNQEGGPTGGRSYTASSCS